MDVKDVGEAVGSNETAGDEVSQKWPGVDGLADAWGVD